MPGSYQNFITDIVQRAQRLIQTYDPWPDSFPSMIEAEAYVDEVCEWKNFQYIKGQDPANTHIPKHLRRKIHFDTAMEGYRAGAFALDTPLVPKAVLDRAVQDNARMMVALVRTWPSSFPHLGAAKKYVMERCHAKGFRPTRLPGIPDWRMISYASHNAVKDAFAAGAFAMNEASRTRQVPPTKYKAEAIDQKVCKRPILKHNNNVSDFSVKTLVNEKPASKPTPPLTPSLFRDQAKQNPARFLLIDIESPTPQVRSNDSNDETYKDLMTNDPFGAIIWDGKPPVWESSSNLGSDSDDVMI